MTSQKKVLDQLHSGEISFSEAAQILGVSKKEIEILFENHDWLPSIERITELCVKEKETIANIRKTKHNRRIVTRYLPYVSNDITLKRQIKIPCIDMFADLFYMDRTASTFLVNNIATTLSNQYVASPSEEGYVWN